MTATISCVAVGQGNCTVAVDEDGLGIVVDCPEHRLVDAVSAARGVGLAHVAAVFASHNDLDHVGAIVAVAENLGADEIRSNHGTVVPTDPAKRAKFRAILRKISELDEAGIENKPAERGATGAAGSITWTVLTPTHAQIGLAQSQSSPNHSSVVLRIEAEGHRVLLPADADGKSFNKMDRDGCDLTADVLVVPHHGADVAPDGPVTGMDWVLWKVGASRCIVSAGPVTQYGHPTPTTIAALSRPPVTHWWCTTSFAGGPDGTVVISLAPTGISVTQ